MRATNLLLLALAIAAPAAAAERYVQAGLVYSTNPSDLAGRNPLFHLRLGQRDKIKGKWGYNVYYQHECSIPDGPPVRDTRDERWHDAVGAAVEYRF